MADETTGLDSLTGQFLRYTELLQSVPNHVPLMAPRDHQEKLYQKQILEAVVYQRWIAPCQSIADIGTGSGFPGIPLALMNPSKQFYLVDRRQNSINFINTVIRVLRIKNVQTICLPGEQLKTQDWRVQAVVARAVSRIRHLLTWSYPILERQGRVILGKGKHCEEEIADIPSHLFSLLQQTHQVFGSLVVFEKR